jgi:hypothetical protein
MREPLSLELIIQSLEGYGRLPYRRGNFETITQQNNSDLSTQKLGFAIHLSGGY